MKESKMSVFSAKYYRKFQGELSEVFHDVVYVYKHFFGFVGRKIAIFFFSFALGFLFFLPGIFLLAFIMFIDPISWFELYKNLGTPSAGTEMLNIFASHTYWVIFEFFLLFVSCVFAFMGLVFQGFLMIKLSLSYIEREPLSLKKSVFFTQNQAKRFLSLQLLIYVISTVAGIFFVALIYGLYLLETSGMISSFLLYIIYLLLAVFLVIGVLVLTYKISFSPVILADSDKKEHLPKARKLLFSSWKISKMTLFPKFLFLLAVLFLVNSPFYFLRDTLASNIRTLQNAYYYKSADIEKLEEGELQYAQLLLQKYENVSLDMMATRLQLFGFFDLLAWAIHFLLLGEMGYVVMASFYKRILEK